jgi:hypothetical protein
MDPYPESRMATLVTAALADISQNAYAGRSGYPPECLPTWIETVDESAAVAPPLGF